MHLHFSHPGLLLSIVDRRGRPRTLPVSRMNTTRGYPHGGWDTHNASWSWKLSRTLLRLGSAVGSQGRQHVLR